MAQPERIQGTSRWYLMDRHGDMVVRVRPGMLLGETAAGDLSFEPAWAQIKLDIAEDGDLLLSSVSDHEIISTAGSHCETDPLSCNHRTEIHLAHNVLQLDRDFVEPVEPDITLELRSPQRPFLFEVLEQKPEPEIQSEPEVQSEPEQAPSHTSLDRATQPGTDMSLPERLARHRTQPARRKVSAAPPFSQSAPEKAHSALQPRTVDASDLTGPATGSVVTEDAGLTRWRTSDFPLPLAAVLSGLALIVIVFSFFLFDGEPAPEPTSLAKIIRGTTESKVAAPLPAETVPEEPTKPTDAETAEGSGTTNIDTTATSLRIPQTDRPAADSEPASATDSSSAASIAAQTPPINEPTAKQETTVAAAVATTTRENTIAPAEAQKKPAPVATAVPSTAPSTRVSEPPAPRQQATRIPAQAQSRSADLSRDLAAADLALSEGRLVTPENSNAFALYSQVLEQDPDSAEANKGLQAVRQGLINRALADLASGSLDEAKGTLEAATNVGANPQLIADLTNEVEYRERLSNARAGLFESQYPIEQLVPINQTPPRWPRNARGIVDAQFTVTEQGEVTDIVVLDNPGRNLERAIMRAMRQWRFEPVLFNGRPLPVRSSVRYTLQP